MAPRSLGHQSRKPHQPGAGTRIPMITPSSAAYPVQPHNELCFGAFDLRPFDPPAHKVGHWAVGVYGVGRDTSFIDERRRGSGQHSSRFQRVGRDWGLVSVARLSHEPAVPVFGGRVALWRGSCGSQWRRREPSLPPLTARPRAVTVHAVDVQWAAVQLSVGRPAGSRSSKFVQLWWRCADKQSPGLRHTDCGR